VPVETQGHRAAVAACPKTCGLTCSTHSHNMRHIGGEELILDKGTGGTTNSNVG
jgi:hypothetical protein